LLTEEKIDENEVEGADLNEIDDVVELLPDVAAELVVKRRRRTKSEARDTNDIKTAEEPTRKESLAELIAEEAVEEKTEPPAEEKTEVVENTACLETPQVVEEKKEAPKEENKQAQETVNQQGVTQVSEVKIDNPFLAPRQPVRQPVRQPIKGPFSV
jgi:hypothetical protein